MKNESSSAKWQLPNLPQTVITYFGVLKAGAVVVFTTPLSEPDELARQVRDSGARVLVTLTRLAETARQVKAQTQLEHVILTNVKDYLPEPRRLLFSLTREAREGHGPKLTLQGQSGSVVRVRAFVAILRR